MRRVMLDVRDDEALSSVTPRHLFTPSNTRLNAVGVCDVELAPQGDFRHVLATVACPVPTYASNGTWQLELRLNDSPTPQANLLFEPVGTHEPGCDLGSCAIHPAAAGRRTVPTQLRVATRTEALRSGRPASTTLGWKTPSQVLDQALR